MSRNFYILAATLAFFALVSGGMTLVPSSFQPGLPANGTLWRTLALFLLLAALASALIGVMSHYSNKSTGAAKRPASGAAKKTGSPRITWAPSKRFLLVGVVVWSSSAG